MNRQEFMNRLEELLNEISAEEKEEALAYYRNYFEDAGIENEAKVIQELESPEKLASSIKAGLKENGVEITDTPVAYNRAGQQNAGNSRNTYESAPASGQNKSDNTTLLVVLIVVAVCTSPVWIGLLGGLAGILFGILCALFGIMVGFSIGGFVCIGVGFTFFWGASVPAGMLTLGIGLLLLTGGILAMILLVLFCGSFLPWVVRGIISLCRSIFHGNRKEQRA